VRLLLVVHEVWRCRPTTWSSIVDPETDADETGYHSWVGVTPRIDLDTAAALDAWGDGEVAARQAKTGRDAERVRCRV